jgi:hypothetical protein
MSEYFPASHMPGGPFNGTDNPPQPVVWAPLGTSAWFCRAVEYPVGNFGGSWTQWVWDVPAYADPLTNPYFGLQFGISTPAALGVDNVQFHFHITCNVDNTPIAGGGPGVPTNKVVALAPRIYESPEVQVPVTGGGVYTPGGLVNINLYRAGPWGGGDSYPAIVYVLGCHIRYKVL